MTVAGSLTPSRAGKDPRVLAGRYSPLSHGIAMNLRVLVALTLREAGIKAGGGVISYVWMLAEPAFLIGLVLFMRTYVRNVAPAIGDNSVIFLLTGLMIFRMVRGIVNIASRAVRSNSELFEMGVIKPPDVVFARTTVEFVSWLIVVIGFFLGMREIMAHEVIADLAGFVFTLLNIYFFCLSLAMLNAVLFALVRIWQKIWKFLTVPLLFISGVLYVPMSMPPEVQAIIEWNPVLHCIEGIRANTYLDYTAMYSPAYLFTLSTILLLLALTVERIYRREIMRSDLGLDLEEELF